MSLWEGGEQAAQQLIHSQNNRTMPASGHIEEFLPPPPVSLKSQPHGLRERKRTLLLEISENRPLYFCLPLCGCRRGKMDWSGEGEESQPAREINAPSATQKQENIKCFSLLLGSCRCAGLVTLATGSGAEHLIGLRVCKRVSRTGEVKVFKWKINPLFTYR